MCNKLSLIILELYLFFVTLFFNVLIFSVMIYAFTDKDCPRSAFGLSSEPGEQRLAHFYPSFL